jgi:hypothetical protein
MAFIINYYRARLFKQDVNKNALNFSQYVQNLGKIELIQADKNECCDPDPCMIRTKEKIPVPVNMREELGITFVGTVAGKSFQRFFHNSTQWSCAAKWTGKEPKWYYQNGYIYLKDLPTLMMDTINIQGIFEDPIAAESYIKCGCTDAEECREFYDYEYPMPLHHVDIILKMIAETELKILLGLGQDITNNTLDNIAETTNPKQ